ncbi:hypothetical protein [Antribacter gilvus]|uniref:hypothetical protein n=1 Tax=Antribacter gilvus TaxID=2304675 RepID=UPI000F789799|nr:hypothetical protein [Antribacter gilvus]
MAFITTADVQAALGSVQASKQGDLALLVDTAQEVVESIVGKVEVGTATHPVPTGHRTAYLPLNARNVTVTVDGVAFAADVDLAAGIVSGLPSSGVVVVSYQAGWAAADIPATVKLAAVEMAVHLWKSGRQTVNRGAPGPSTDATTPYGFAIPRRVRELCATVSDDPGFA